MKTEYIETAGWDAITRAFEKLYPEQTDPIHYAPIISWRLGGEDPLDGISVYDGGDYYHFVTYGLSELYDKESEDFDYSGYGFELTLKLKKSSLKNDEEELNCICGILQTLGRITFENGDIFQPFEYIYTGQKTGYGFELTLKLKKSSLKNDEEELNCICGILQTLGRITFENGDIFQPFEYIYTGQKTGMDSKSVSNITGFVTVPDEAGEINTPNGLLQFVQLVGMTDAELKAVADKKNTVEEMVEKLGHTLTDFKRKSLV